MDLATGAKDVFVMMTPLTRGGASKTVEAFSYPLTGAGCVTRVYTDKAVFLTKPAGVTVANPSAAHWQSLRNSCLFRSWPRPPESVPLHWAVYPPSTACWDPVMNEARSESRNVTSSATSSALPKRPIGCFATKPSYDSFDRFFSSGVSM